MGGTAFAKIDEALSSATPYSSFRKGAMSATDYQKWIEDCGREKVSSLNQDQINLSARFPHDKHDFVRRALAQCHALDIIPSSGSGEHYDAGAVDRALAGIDRKFNHSGNLTYIFPEESAFLYALARSGACKRAAFMGSYYGYWAAAAKAALPELEVTLLDINPAVMQLARRNFEELGLDRDASFLVGDAEGLVARIAGIDLLVLDAEGPKSPNVPADYRDKAIYYPHLKAALGALVPGALVVAHNVILSNFTDGAYFEEKQLDYRQQYAKFLPLLREQFVYTVIDSTEGILVARKL